MRSRELDAAIAALRRLRTSLASKSIHDERLDQLIRELVAVRKGGKIAPRRLTRIVGLISEVVFDLAIGPGGQRAN